MQKIKVFTKIFRFVLVLLFFLILSENALSQVYTGGNASVNYDKGYYVDVAPLLGYRVGIADFGVSPFYSYSHRENKDPKYSFGGRVFTQLTFYRNIYAHAELQLENIEVSATEQRKWVLSMPLGAGYRYEIAPNTMAYGMILYDVLLDEDSPARNPIIRGGVTYSF